MTKYLKNYVLNIYFFYRITTPVLRTLPTIPSTYLPPEIYVSPVTTTTKAPKTTFSRRIVTTTPAAPKIGLSDEVETKTGYNYPKPEIRFDLPKPTPKIQLKLVTETVPVTYLPPTVAQTYLPPVEETTKRITTTRRPTTTTRKTTLKPVTERNLFVEEGYDYKKPSVRTQIKEDIIPVTYLPPVVETTKRITTTRRPTTTTRKTTVTPVTKRNLIVDQGYDYIKPSVKTIVDDEFLPVTYLPPVVLSTTTTRRPTPSTTRSPRTTTVVLRTSSKEGYDYPKPSIPFELPTERISVKSVQVSTIPSTYLPPVETTTRKLTTSTTTTPRPTTEKVINNYLPPEEPKGYFYDKPSIPFFY